MSWTQSVTRTVCSTVVVQRVAARDTLDNKPGGFVQAVGDVRLLVAVDPAVGVGQVPT